MTDTERRILIFEDTDEQYELIHEPLEHFLEGEGIEIQRFGGFEDDEIPEGEASAVAMEAVTEPSPPSLVVLDWELTKLPIGVRREHVKVACEEARVPLCVYHREGEGAFAQTRRMKKWEEHVIMIDPKEDPADVAEQCANLAKSFIDIHRSLERAEDGRLKSALREILGAPLAAESQLDQYSWGRSEAVGLARDRDITDEARPRAASTFVGYWIHNQLLQFPGVLLNSGALASYLGIESEALRGRPELKAEFDDALYEGPFSEIKERWWTSGIDGIRADHTVGDSLAEGLELVESMGFDEVDPAQCVAGHEGAGFYCILTDEPVCKEHSVRPKGWIPIGASRARIYEDEYKRMKPWMPD